MQTLAQTCALAALLIVAGTSGPALAQRPTGHTPTLFGAQTLERGGFAVGVSSGWPESTFNLHFGIARDFDVGLLLGATYGRPAWDGDRQNVGFAGRIPIRWTLAHGRAAAFGIRLSPYVLLGDIDPGPSFSGGADLALLFDIAFPRHIKLILGPELRTGFASIIVPTVGRRTGYDGALWANLGFEASFSGHVHLGLIFNGGGYWGSGPLGSGGLFRARINFGYAF